MISLAIVGYGKMGKEVESILDKNLFTLTGKYDIDNEIRSNLDPVPDVAIEFSTPKSAIDNIEFLASKKINIVCGTTGWYDKAEQVKEIISRYDTGFVYASNFSIGVNIFFSIIKNAGNIINEFTQYDTSMEETHHTAKLDKPSGTALRTAEYLLEEIKRKEKISSDKTSPEAEEINILSHREGSVFGNHKVIFDSPADTITIEHNAKSRRGFAEGALAAAKFIHGKKGFYKFEDIFKNLI